MPEQRVLGLLCDLDGVVRLWPAHVVAAAEEAAGLPRGSIQDMAFAPDLLTLAVTGGISDEAWREEVIARLRAAYPEADAGGAVAGIAVGRGSKPQQSGQAPPTAQPTSIGVPTISIGRP